MQNRSMVTIYIPSHIPTDNSIFTATSPYPSSLISCINPYQYRPRSNQFHNRTHNQPTHPPSQKKKMALRLTSLLLSISPLLVLTTAQDFFVGSSSSGACIGNYCCDGSLIGGSSGNSNDASDFTCCLGDPNHGIINGVPDMTCSAGSAVPLTAATGSAAAAATASASASGTRSSGSAVPTSDDFDDGDEDEDDSSSSTGRAAAATATPTASGPMSASTTSQRSGSTSSSDTATPASSNSASSSSESPSAGATGNAAVGSYQISVGQIAVGVLALGYNFAL